MIKQRSRVYEIICFAQKRVRLFWLVKCVFREFYFTFTSGARREWKFALFSLSSAVRKMYTGYMLIRASLSFRIVLFSRAVSNIPIFAFSLYAPPFSTFGLF